MNKSEVKQKWNEAKTKQKRSENCKAKQDKVKIYKNEEKYQGSLLVCRVYTHFYFTS